MSHFTVGVLLKEGDKDLEELLAPYQENNMGDCPEEYLEFVDCTDEIVDGWENYKNNKEEYDKECDSIEEYATQYFGYITEDGKYGYYENPNAKWDWYVIGGRWSNMLLTKDGEKTDFARLKDIDWNKISENKRLKAEHVWDNQPESWFEKHFVHGINDSDTRESYVKRMSEFSTAAVITPDGKWHEKGTMGWFGISSETEEEANQWSNDFHDSFIKNADQDLILVIVDCHI